MITLSQIRAARALIGWTQDDLAAAAMLSLPSINNLERGLYSPRSETLNAVRVALETGGVEFTENTGVRLRQDDHAVSAFSGPQFIRYLDDDIFSVLRGPQDEIAGCSCDERNWMEYGSVTNKTYIEMRERKGWRERIIIPDTARFITSSVKAYRLLPAEQIGAMTYEIYGNRLALIEWEAMRVTLIKNSRIADSFLRQFNILWRMAKPLTGQQVKRLERLKEKE